VQQAGFERRALETFLSKYGSHPCDSLLLVTMADFCHDVDVQVQDDQKAEERQVKISANARVEDDGNVVHLQLELSASAMPVQPLDICFVIDKSGSMNGAVTPEVSKSDLVRRATSACLDVLGAGDRACLVLFDHGSTVHFWQTMDLQGKAVIRQTLEEVRNGGQTDITGALRQACALMQQVPDGRRGCVFLLTDGRPEGVQDIAPDEFLGNEQGQGLRFPVHVMGFGYDTDAALLRRMSLAANSSLGFISDSSMAATTMANLVAHASQTVISDLRIGIAPVPPLELAQELAPEQSWVQDQKRCCGCVVTGQTRKFNVALRVPAGQMPSPVLLRVFAEYQTPTGREEQFFAAQLRDNGRWDEFVDVRQRFVAAASELLQPGRPRAKFDKLMTLLGEIEHAQAKALLAECRGQIEQALAPGPAWGRWGESYVAVLARAHELEYPLNFKDESTKGYATATVAKLAAQTLEVFKELPAPRATPRQQFVDWSRMATRDSGCVAGSCLVRMKHGTLPLSLLKKGDELRGGGRVLCMVRCTASAFVTVGSLKITPYHPIKKPGDATWDFPVDVFSGFEAQEQACFSFVLEGAVSMQVEGYEVLALGHGIEDDPVAAHPYFGSAVLEDLRLMPGFEEGLVHVVGVERCMKSRQVTRLVSG
jgi:hypothetical protein